MRQQNHLAALVGDLRDRRSRALKPRQVADLAVLHRDIEVDPEQHVLAPQVGLIECAKGGHDRISVQMSLPIATAVSAMRLEKPHSLSYQDITRTSVPSMTLVWSMWKLDEGASWLKSIETFGRSV